jgi:uncharacterized protein
MKIRTITVFIDPNRDSLEKTLPFMGAFAYQATRACQAAGIEVQTCRLATAPFPHWAPIHNLPDFVAMVIQSEILAQQHGFTYLALGPALAEEPASYSLISPALAATSNLFFSGALTSQNLRISKMGIYACADIIAQCAPMSQDGFTNLRFTAIANVQPNGPFFPSAYHQSGNPPAFAIGMECADEILSIFQTSQTLPQARQQLITHFETAAEVISTAIDPLLEDFPLEFAGFDFSCAPYPQSWCSAGGALEALGIQQLGDHGSVAASAFLAESLKLGNWKKAGFNGLMLPVLEDNILAQRAAEGTLSIKDLLLFSCVCGTGLDTVPLPGESSPQALAALLLDVAALSLRLNKPLTARLMPIPGKKAGDLVAFDFEFFAKGKVMALQPAQLTGLLGGLDEIEMTAGRT